MAMPPATLELGPRPTLCTSLTWPQVWSAPQSFEIAILQGPVETPGGRTSINVPAPGFPLLVARAGLRRG
jgi:hypothetical protein